ncbi:hypothetical protein [Phenylobacterium sp.]|uniref:DUF4870 family protein n=1 Tax=Phenylobacterium sp. TaxID=1871053 RepID=UPI002CAB0A63|nr:hypothetical protein [Phenylobacterium sp.]HLZ74137.1 hypothetical protein [Phenylobacterium sp.]
MTYQYDRDPGVIYEDRAMPAVVYALYILGLFHGLTLIIGLIMAYVLRSSAGPANASHYTYQIRTFWTALVGFLIGCALVGVGIPLSFILIGIPIAWAGGVICFLAWLWAMIRCIVGAVRLAEGRPIAQPYGWAV